MRSIDSLITSTFIIRMGIVELLAAVTLKPHQHPAERRETIGLGNELLRKWAVLSIFASFRSLRFFQNAETKSVTSTAEHFEASLMA